MALQPNLLQAGLIVTFQMTVGNTDRTGTTGTYYGPLTPGLYGSLITGVVFQAITTTVTGVVRVFISPDGGTTKYLIAEVPTPAVTVSGSVGGAQVTWVPPFGPMPLPNGSSLYFNLNNSSETWNVTPVGGNF
jgi:hypothetical protein